MKLRIMLSKLLLICAFWQIAAADEEKCMLSPEVGTYISSENFPNNFNSDRGGKAHECLYKLKVENGKKVLLTFYHVDLSTYRCDGAFIQLMKEDTWEDDKYLCAKSFNKEQVLSDDHELEFKFIHTPWTGNYRGWLAKYEAVDSNFKIPTNNGSYLLHYPANLLRNRTEQVCVESLNDQNLDDLDVTVEVVKVSGDNNRPPIGRPIDFAFRSQTVAEFGDFGRSGGDARADSAADKESFSGKLSNGCLDIETNHKSGEAMLRVVFKKNNQIEEELYRFVKIQDTQDKILIQTDKGKYKSGSTVKIRWLTLDDNLRNSGLELAEVNVADPKSRIIQQWKSPKNTDGINQKEFDLFEEAPLGRYTITVKVDDTTEHEAFFEVDEYILPRFEVSIKDPSAVVPGSDSTWKVCAVYTHGAPVPGQIKASFSTGMRFFEDRWRPNIGRPRPPPNHPFRDQKILNKTVKTTEESTCTEIVLGTEDLKKLTSEFDRRRINLNVEFIEDGTKEVRNAETNNNLVMEEFKIGFGSSSKSYSVGGFSYRGQIKVENHDGSGRPNENLWICTRLFTDVEKVRDRFNNPWGMNEGPRKLCRNLNTVPNRLRNGIRNKCNRNIYYGDDFLEAAEEIEDMQYGKNCTFRNTDNMGMINFHIPLNGLSKEVKKLSIKVTAPDYTPKEDMLKIPKGKLDVNLSHTNAPVSMSIESKDRSELACGETNQVTVNFAGPKDATYKMKYYLLAGGQNIKSDFVDVNLSGVSDDLNQDYVQFILELKNGGVALKEDANKRTKQVNIPVSIDYRSYPDIKLVIMVAADNETLTDSHEFKVGYCTKHKVSLKLNKEQTQPRGEVKMDIKADTGSKCGLSLIDKSVDILGNNNKVTQAKIGDILRSIKSSKISAFDENYEVRNSCPKVHKIIQVFLDAGRQIFSDMPIFKKCDTYKREKAPSYDDYDDYDNYDGGYSFMSSSVQNRRPQPVPMNAGGNRVFASSGSAYGGSDFVPGGVGARRKDDSENRREGQQPEFNPKDAPEVRTEFPETWLFDLETFDGSPRSVNAPDTLTSWTAEAVCLSPSNGLGVATPQNLIVTQDFFSDLRLPATVKRGETFPMNISVFNNLKSELPLVLTIQGDNIEADKNSEELCLNGQSSTVVSIPTRALKAGDVNISVALEISSVKGCQKAKANAGFVDRLERPLLVKPEGIPVEEVESNMVCLKTGESQDVQFDRLTLPNQVVQDSDRAYAFMSGDVMAASLKNIGNLVRLPTGCGEQNMIRLAPNVYLLDYMKSNSKKDPELEKKAIDYMRIGYDRQARYRHSDGSYSIWGGDNDKDSSTWLTAFVVKVFSQASKYIEVDDTVLKKSVNWLIDTQTPGGCFKKRGYVHDAGLQGGDSNSSLNAFVLNSLYEFNQFINKPGQPPSNFEERVKASIRNAARCIMADGKKNDYFRDDLYSLSLANYAINLATTNGKNPGIRIAAQNFKKALDEKKNTTIPGALFWDTKPPKDTDRYRYHYPRSLAVEVTAYNIMSLILENRTDEAVNAVKWMARHRNSQGGFSSTQDTVVGLQALSQYGNIIGGYSTDMTLKVTSDGNEISRLKLNEDNKQVLNTESLPQLPAEIGFKLQGSGCVILQTSVRYNVPESKKAPAFIIKHKFKKDVLEICTSYIGNKASTEMAIMEVEMLSGYSARNPEDLINEVEYDVKKVEVKEKENIVVLYFDQLDKKERCVELEMITEFKVKDLKPARIHVYDYYNTEDSHEILYNEK